MTRQLGTYDGPLWASIDRRAMALQRCNACAAFRYPPGPVCASCLSPDAAWTPVRGDGEIVSWAVFHRGYLAEYPPPYNVIAVRLAEGPMMISNLEGDEPSGSWIGQSVRIVYTEGPSQGVLPRFRLSESNTADG